MVRVGLERFWCGKCGIRGMTHVLPPPPDEPESELPTDPKVARDSVADFSDDQDDWARSAEDGWFYPD